ncbi:tissue factor pathway inhibitor 2-like [Saccostrea echinata]|uniref:tissue factor pathway inhibitor 2-like n=1 Tax=Saccostrea echinata TaxID=191078 RepID=UPI002A7FA786|nr:tissue factor pathway inhibitor 2-like [Saccostrea echinata]
MERKFLLGLLLSFVIVVVNGQGYRPRPPANPICAFPRDPGPCRGSCPRYYYNTRTGTCQRFTYGCCGGNANNFQSRGLCNRVCRNRVCPAIACLIGPCTSQKCPAFPEAICVIAIHVASAHRWRLTGTSCTEAKDPGPCKGFFRRWYFHPSDNTCRRFIYGGCGGNGNNHRSLKSCLDACNDGCPNGTNPDKVRCIVGACTIQTCRRYPWAICVPRCNGCISRFILFGRDVTNRCHRRVPLPPKRRRPVLIVRRRKSGNRRRKHLHKRRKYVNRRGKLVVPKRKPTDRNLRSP